tara:strand:+ start:1843 stop:2361 length:519 start_codon:yes stop_codon:yes gene_type:complete
LDITSSKELAGQCLEFIRQFDSVLIGTSDTTGEPDVSYSPVIYHGSRFYILISQLSPHTGHLYQRPTAALLFIEDERDSEQIYARRRLSFSCSAQPCKRDQLTWQTLIPLFRNRFGPIIDTLTGLNDFVLFQLQPTQGRWVTGFGRAYGFSGMDFREPKHLGGGSANETSST